MTKISDRRENIHGSYPHGAHILVRETELLNDNKNKDTIQNLINVMN